jgi:hypothetical protein
MKRIALHDAERRRRPNLALMKLSAHHKSRGDDVSWFIPGGFITYDIIYSAKVFSWTKDETSLPADAIRGGTGYGGPAALPDEVEHTCPDYSLYPGMDHSMGFLTRGCIRSCPWCVVPQKEGAIRAHADIEEFTRHRKVTLMDNNVLAHPHGIAQIEKSARLGIRVDFNQGLDARLIDAGTAKRLAALKWIRFIRLACDSRESMPHVKRAVTALRNAGHTGEIMAYVLVRDIDDALERVNFLRSLGVLPFAQPFRPPGSTDNPARHLMRFARWVNLRKVFNSTTWENYEDDREIFKNRKKHGKPYPPAQGFLVPPARRNSPAGPSFVITKKPRTRTPLSPDLSEPYS